MSLIIIQDLHLNVRFSVEDLLRIRHIESALSEIKQIGEKIMGKADDIKAVLTAIDGKTDALASDLSEVTADVHTLLDMVGNPPAPMTVEEAEQIQVAAQSILDKLTPIQTALNELGKTDPTGGNSQP